MSDREYRSVLVCGGRDYGKTDAELEAMRERISRLKSWTVVIHGDASGADKTAAGCARYLGMHVAAVPALWEHYDKAAGPRRNAAMLALKPELVIAFRGGRGTANCISQAEKLGIRVEHVAA